MNETTGRSATSILPRMRPRDPGEPGRVANTLELFFDLIFVVAVAINSAELAHGINGEHPGTAIGMYLMVFFAIWWAWMNFTWFASAFDTDDWLYRVLTILQMGGAIVLAAGVAVAASSNDWTVVTLGYVVMRIALIPQWLRAAWGTPHLRRTAIRYAIGISIVQALWVVRIFLPEDWVMWSFFVLMVCEVMVPPIAERAGLTPWHPHHIAERYGLFTIIVLGESVLASTTALIDGLENASHVWDLVGIAACGLVIAAAMWWVYFNVNVASQLTTARTAFTFGYVHFIILAAAAAISAGIETAIGIAAGEHEGLQGIAAGAAISIPVALYFFFVWLVITRHGLDRARNSIVLLWIAVILVSALLPTTIVWVAVAAIALTATVESARGRRLD